MPKSKQDTDSDSLKRDLKLMASHEWDNRGRFRLCLKCNIKQYQTVRFSPETLQNKWLPRIVPKCL